IPHQSRRPDSRIATKGVPRSGGTLVPGGNGVSVLRIILAWILHLISIYNCVYTAQCRSRWCSCLVQENHCPVWIDIPSSSAVFRRRRTRACEQFLPKRSREGGQDRPRSRAGQWLGSMRTSAFFRRHAGPEKEETASDETSVTHAANCRGSGSV